MKEPESFILNNFDEEKLKHIVFYIQQTYNREVIIYGSVGFCTKMAFSLCHGPWLNDSTLDDDVYYKNLNNKEGNYFGLIGKYTGMPVICVPELNAINAVIVPDWGNFLDNYFKENKGE